MNTGWRMISASGRPPYTALRAGAGANRMKAISTIATSATPASARYAPAKGTLNRSRVRDARFGPSTAPSKPPAMTSETARSRPSSVVSSAAANRYRPALAL